MDIAISSDVADRIASLIFPNGRPPLTKTRPTGNVNNLDDWLSNSKGAISRNSWKRSGLRICLVLAELSDCNSGERFFPAEFQCSDGRRRWPDKAVVKACFEDRLIEDIPERAAEGLLFRPTFDGLNWLSVGDS